MPGSAPVVDTEPATGENIDEAVESVDMNLDQTNAAEHFAAEPTGDMWSQPAEEDDDDTRHSCAAAKKNNQTNLKKESRE